MTLTFVGQLILIRDTLTRGSLKMSVKKTLQICCEDMKGSKNLEQTEDKEFTEDVESMNQLMHADYLEDIEVMRKAPGMDD